MRAVVSTLSAAVVFVVAPWVLADDPPSGTGVTGGALLGAEVVLMTEALAGVEPAWGYVTGGAVGAGLGAWGGYRVEQDAKRDASFYLLTAGVALFIPTAVWMSNLRARRADPELLPMVPEQARRSPPALIVLTREGPAPGLPAVELEPVFSRELRLRFGLPRVMETRVPVLAAAF